MSEHMWERAMADVAWKFLQKLKVIGHPAAFKGHQVRCAPSAPVLFASHKTIKNIQRHEAERLNHFHAFVSNELPYLLRMCRICVLANLLPLSNLWALQGFASPHYCRWQERFLAHWPRPVISTVCLHIYWPFWFSLASARQYFPLCSVTITARDR